MKNAYLALGLIAIGAAVVFAHSNAATDQDYMYLSFGFGCWMILAAFVESGLKKS